MLRKSWRSWSFSFDYSFNSFDNSLRSLFSHILVILSICSSLSFITLIISDCISLISDCISLVSHCISLVWKLTSGSNIGWTSWNSKSTFILELSSLLTGVWWFRILSSGFISAKVFFVNIFDVNFSLPIVLTASIVVFFTGVTS